MSSREALEAAIDENPDAADLYLVYADLLQSLGDPLGEVIAHAQHSPALLGPSASLLAHDPSPVWQHGVLRSVRLRWDTYPERDDEAAAELAAFLALPVARFLQTLVLGAVPAEDSMRFDYLVRVMARLGKPRALRELVVGRHEQFDMSGTSAGGFDALLPVLPYLRSLTIHAGDIELGVLVHDTLTSLAIQSGGIGKTALSDLHRAELPALDRLELWLGTPAYGGLTDATPLRPILAGELFPRLTHLGLRNAAFTDELVEQLARSAILPRLRSLDLSMGTLSDAGVSAMAAVRERFAHLDHLELDDNALDQTKELAATLAKQVHVGDAHAPTRVEPDIASRYPSVGE
jgi:uncharacterized protein (TIGR02996 family)